jgi:hypothetical protein
MSACNSCNFYIPTNERCKRYWSLPMSKICYVPYGAILIEEEEAV